MSPFQKATAVCGFLLLAVFLVFGQTLRYGFVNYDDGQYVYEKPEISAGLTAHGIAWAFTHGHVGHWHPLTSISHMLDCQLYGLWPGGHHLTNVLLHAATSILLFLVLWRMTGSLWPSALVAAVFAVHPLRAESVAWVSERKDVLSGLCFMLTLAAYTAYVRRPFSWARYLTVVAAFAAGLMAKPMLVTLPCLLLLLDYWPLGRTKWGLGIRDWGLEIGDGQGREGGEQSAEGSGPRAEGSAESKAQGPRPKTLAWLIVEKIPLALMTVACSLAALATENKVMASMESMPWRWRVANALVSYVVYLEQFFCPLGLAVFYPHPRDTIPTWSVIVAAGVLLAVSAAALLWWRKYPFLLVGWLWYLGMLLPVIELVQLGRQARADRYTYLPQIGIAIALVWGVERGSRFWPYRRWTQERVSRNSGGKNAFETVEIRRQQRQTSVRHALGIASVGLVAGLMACAWRQTSYWRDSETLWAHAVACTERNSVTHTNLGLALAERGRFDDAIGHYRKALEIERDVLPYYNLGIALAALGRPAEAVDAYRSALAVKPDDAKVRGNLGAALVGLGRVDEAVVEYRKALEIDADDAAANSNLGAVLAARGQVDEAIAHYRRVLKTKPEMAAVHFNLGAALYHQGKSSEALDHWREALRLAAAQGNRALADTIRTQIDRSQDSLPSPEGK
jgi:tetratricopeptide (TPR) repeat protein